MRPLLLAFVSFAWTASVAAQSGPAPSAPTQSGPTQSGPAPAPGSLSLAWTVAIPARSGPAPAPASLVALPLPLPPVPPDRPPSVDAPVPDIGLRSPGDTVVKSPVSLDMTINHRPSPAPGFGYSPGGQYQQDNDKKLFVPGVRMTVPFD
jgi:hypothetical protein